MLCLNCSKPLNVKSVFAEVFLFFSFLFFPLRSQAGSGLSALWFHYGSMVEGGSKLEVAICSCGIFIDFLR